MNRRPIVLEKIISGGQTGADRAGLDAALEAGFPCGGWVPEGKIAEDGVIPDRYPLTPLKKGGYRLRTIQNVVDSDATVIFYFSDLEGGTEETVLRCIKQGKPYRLIDGAEIAVGRAVELVVEFVERGQIRRLNVAGPRGSKCPAAYPYVKAVMDGVLCQ